MKGPSSDFNVSCQPNELVPPKTECPGQRLRHDTEARSSFSSSADAHFLRLQDYRGTFFEFCRTKMAGHVASVIPACVPSRPHKHEDPTVQDVHESCLQEGASIIRTQDRSAYMALLTPCKFF